MDVQNYYKDMTTNQTAAQRLRAALKTAAFSARRVSVREHHSTLHVTIRDASVPRSTVVAIADTFAVVRRCEKTGEILCGGNTFVKVAYAPELVAPITARIGALLERGADGEIVDLGDGFRAVKLSRARGATYPDEVRIWGPGFDECNSIACGVYWAAERIAVAYLDARALTADGSATERP